MKYPEGAKNEIRVGGRFASPQEIHILRRNEKPTRVESRTRGTMKN